MSKIIYKQDSGIVSIIMPNLSEINPATGNTFTIDEIKKMYQLVKNIKLYLIPIFRLIDLFVTHGLLMKQI